MKKTVIFTLIFLLSTCAFAQYIDRNGVPESLSDRVNPSIQTRLETIHMPKVKHEVQNLVIGHTRDILDAGSNIFESIGYTFLGKKDLLIWFSAISFDIDSNDHKCVFNYSCALGLYDHLSKTERDSFTFFDCDVSKIKGPCSDKDEPLKKSEYDIYCNGYID